LAVWAVAVLLLTGMNFYVYYDVKTNVKPRLSDVSMIRDEVRGLIDEVTRTVAGLSKVGWMSYT